VENLIKQQFEGGGSRFEVGGWRFEVRGSRFEVRGSRLEVRGWRCEVGGARLEVRGWSCEGGEVGSGRGRQVREVLRPGRAREPVGCYFEEQLVPRSLIDVT
jgi:hypothetical protein